jgi:hypothetical protein
MDYVTAQGQSQTNVFALITDEQWAAITVPTLGFSIFLLCCIYRQHVRINQLENQQQKPAVARYPPYHSNVRHILAGNEPINYV